MSPHWRIQEESERYLLYNAVINYLLDEDEKFYARIDIIIEDINRSNKPLGIHKKDEK